MLLSIEPSEHRPRGTVITVADFAEASRQYAEVRNSTGEGSSTFPFGDLADGDKRYHVSYNGRVWLGNQLMYCPAGRAE